MLPFLGRVRLSEPEVAEFVIQNNLLLLEMFTNDITSVSYTHLDVYKRQVHSLFYHEALHIRDIWPMMPIFSDNYFMLCSFTLYLNKHEILHRLVKVTLKLNLTKTANVFRNNLHDCCFWKNLTLNHFNTYTKHTHKFSRQNLHIYHFRQSKWQVGILGCGGLQDVWWWGYPHSLLEVDAYRLLFMLRFQSPF